MEDKSFRQRVSCPWRCPNAGPNDRPSHRLSDRPSDEDKRSWWLLEVNISGDAGSENARFAHFSHSLHPIT